MSGRVPDRRGVGPFLDNHWYTRWYFRAIKRRVIGGPPWRGNLKYPYIVDRRHVPIEVGILPDNSEFRIAYRIGVRRGGNVHGVSNRPYPVTSDSTKIRDRDIVNLFLGLARVSYPAFDHLYSV